MDITNTASSIETVQFTAAVIAALAALWQLMNVISDTSAQSIAVDRRKTRTLLAQDRMMGEVARTGVVLVFLAIGLFSLVLPPPGGSAHDDLGELLQPMATRIGLLIATAILMLDGVRALRSRHAYDKILVAERLAHKDDVQEIQKAAVTVEHAATVVESAAERAAVAAETADQKIDTLQETATEIKDTVDVISEKVAEPPAKPKPKL